MYWREEGRRERILILLQDERSRVELKNGAIQTYMYG